MKRLNEQKALEVVEECPASRLSGMLIAARIASVGGQKEGCVTSGGYKGYFKEVDGQAELYLITRTGEKLEDYLEAPSNTNI